jgi:hypothetical protein
MISYCWSCTSAKSSPREPKQVNLGAAAKSGLAAILGHLRLNVG